MSRTGDIRMHVEHLFEGRTLTRETIELKEEVYGNLVARYEDYVAQGMTDDEAYRRTCEAVGSLDDVLEGEKDEEPRGTVADERTVVMPASAPEPQGAPPVPGETKAADSGTHKRWSTGKIVAVVAGAIAVVAIALVAVSAIAGLVAREAYDGTTQQIQQVDEPTAQTDATSEPQAQDQTTTTQGSQSGNGEQNRNGQGNAGAGASATGLDAEVYAHSVSSLAPTTLASSGSEVVASIAGALPLSGYLTSVEADAATGTVTLTYTYQDRDLLAYDDDCVDRAIVYDVVALMSSVGDLSRVEVIEVEDDGYDYDRDRQIFDRAMVEGVLGTQLTSDLLTEDSWNALRDQVMTKRYWDPIWERGEVD